MASEHGANTAHGEASSPRAMVDLADVARAVARARYWIFAGAVLGLCAGFARVFFVTPEYSSEALVVVRDIAGEGAGLAGAGQFGALASLAGISLAENSRRAEYLALLKSRRLAEGFIRENSLKQKLYAERWVADEGTWRVTRWRVPPTDADAVDKFAQSVLQVVEDRKTGLIRVRVTWSDRKLAAGWANGLVDLLNREVRINEARSAARSIEYLRAELDKVQPAEVSHTIGRLLESNLNRIMLANTQPDYALRVVEPALPPDEDRPIRPRPVVDSIVGLILGAVAAIIVALYRRRSEWWR